MLLGRLAVIAGCLAAAVASGCGGPPGQVANPDAVLPAGENSAAFLDRISSQPSVSENDVMRGILLLLDGRDQAGNFAQRLEGLRDKGIVGASWDFDADRPITKGKFAYMIYQACEMPGGIALTLLGPNQRHCLRELQYREVMSEGSPFSKVTGMEFVAVLGRADVYIRTGKVPKKSGVVE
ncbi:MAG: hypothetical protein ACYTF6_00310 [Planctomycetota bacterium]|jgi:hypothetical protein